MVLRVQENVIRTVVSAALDVLSRQKAQYEGGFIGEARRLLDQHKGIDYLGWSPTTGFYYHAENDHIYRGRQKGGTGKEMVDVRDLPGNLLDDPRDYKPRDQSLPPGFQEAILSELTSTK